MNVLHVSPWFAPAWRYGGVVECTYQLCRYLAAAGAAVRVLTTDSAGRGRALESGVVGRFLERSGLDVRYYKRVMVDSVAPGLLGRLIAEVRWADVVHLQCAYSFPVIPTLACARVLAKPVVWSPHGAMQRWRDSRRVRAKRVWEKLCRAAAPARLLIHTTCAAEARESAERFRGVPICVIPHGVTIPDRTDRTPRGKVFRLGFLGRLDPKKGIERLLEACALITARGSLKYSLVIAGAGSSDYERRIREMIERLGIAARVELLGDVRGEAKERMFASTDVMIVPSYTENFAYVVAEALAHGEPVIASKGTPWRRVEEVGCGLWTGNDPQNLAETIERSSRMDLETMGRIGRRWMVREFSWGSCADQMLAQYRSLLVPREGAPSRFVRAISA